MYVILALNQRRVLNLLWKRRGENIRLMTWEDWISPDSRRIAWLPEKLKLGGILFLVTALTLGSRGQTQTEIRTTYYFSGVLQNCRAEVSQSATVTVPP